MVVIQVRDQGEYVRKRALFKGACLMGVNTTTGIYLVTNYKNETKGHLYAYHEGIWYMDIVKANRFTHSYNTRPDPITLVSPEAFKALVEQGYTAMVAVRVRGG